MKKLLIIFLLLILLLAGCSTNVKDVNNSDVNNNETIQESEENELNNNVEKTNDSKENEQSKENETANKQNVENIEGQKDNLERKDNSVSDEESKVKQTNNENKKEIEDTNSKSNENKDNEDEKKDENSSKNSLKIEGLVEKELTLNLDELKEMNDIIFQADFYWLNNFGTTGYTNYKGVNLWELLAKKALIKDSASIVSIIAQDGYSMEYTVEQVQMEYMDETNPDNKYPMIIAWEENGNEYSIDEGNPYKLIVGQTEPDDINKPQWVSNIDSIIIE